MATTNTDFKQRAQILFAQNKISEDKLLQLTAPRSPPKKISKVVNRDRKLLPKRPEVNHHSTPYNQRRMERRKTLEKRDYERVDPMQLLPQGLFAEGLFPDNIPLKLDGLEDLTAQFSRFNDNIRQTVSIELTKMVEDLRGTLITVTESFSTDTEQMTKNISSVINRASDKISDAHMTHSFSIDWNKCCTAVALITIFLMFMKKYDKRIVAILTLSAIGIKMIAPQASECFDMLINWYNSRSEGDEGVMPQGFFDIKDGLVSGILIYLYKTFFTDAINGDRFVTDFLRKSSSMKKIKEGLDFSTEFLLKLVQEFVNFILKLMGKESIELVSDPLMVIKGFAYDAAKIARDLASGEVVMDSRVAERILELDMKFNEYVNGLPNNALALPGMRDRTILLYNMLRDLKARVEAENLTGQGPRIPPLGIMFTGPSGVGKSHCMYSMLHEITGRILPEDKREHFVANPDDFRYDRCASDKFFEGYRGQINVVFDEVGATTDVPGGLSENPYLEVIMAINNICWRLPMAKLENKGNTTFRSLMVWMTSNRRHFNDLQSLHHKEAFTRRLGVPILCTVKREFSMDPNELDPWNRKFKNPGKFMNDYRHMEFYEYDFLQDDKSKLCYSPLNDWSGVKAGPFSYSEVRQMILDRYELNMSKGQQFIKDIKDAIARGFVWADQQKVRDLACKGPTHPWLNPQGAMGNPAPASDNGSGVGSVRSDPPVHIQDGSDMDAGDAEETFSDAQDSWPEETARNEFSYNSGWDHVAWGDQVCGSPPPGPVDDNNNPIEGVISGEDAIQESIYDRAVDVWTWRYGDKILNDLKAWGSTMRAMNRPDLKFGGIGNDYKSNPTLNLLNCLVASTCNKIIIGCYGKAANSWRNPFRDAYMHAESRFSIIPCVSANDIKRMQQVMAHTIIRGFKRNIDETGTTQVFVLSDKIKHNTYNLLDLEMLVMAAHYSYSLNLGRQVTEGNLFLGAWDHISQYPEEISYWFAKRKSLKMFLQLWVGFSTYFFTVNKVKALVSSLVYGDPKKEKEVEEEPPAHVLKKMEPMAEINAEGFMKLKDVRKMQRQEVLSTNPQAKIDQECYEIVSNLTNRNLYKFSLPEASVVAGHMFMITQDGAFTLRHFGDHIMKLKSRPDAKDLYMKFWRASQDASVAPPKHVPILDIDVYELGDIDTRIDKCLLSFKLRTFDLVSSPVDKFISEKTKIFEKPEILLCIPNPNSQAHNYFYRQCNRYGKIDILYPEKPKDENTKQYRTDIGFEYAIPTKSGNCMAILGHVNPGLGKTKILGFHVAGNGSHGYACRVTQEEMRDYVRLLNQARNVSPNDLVEDEGGNLNPEGIIVEHGLFEPIGKADPPTKEFFISNVKKSPLHNKVFPSKCSPARLMPFTNAEGESIDPMSIRRSEYARQRFGVDQELLEITTQQVVAEVFKNSTNSKEWKPRKMTFEEAVSGIDAVDFVKCINRKSSPGWPKCEEKHPGFPGKTFWLGKDGKVDFDSEPMIELRKEVEELEEKLKNGIRPLFVYKDFPKDERLPKEKAKAGKTRFISGSPLTLLILLRMYFLDLVSWLKDNNVNNSIAVGVNVYSDDWKRIINRLLAVTPDSEEGRFIRAFIAGDYSKFDCSLLAVFMKSFLDLADAFYGKEFSKIRELLFEEITNSRHITGDKIYAWSGGNPSGNFFTAEVNSFVGLMVATYACASIVVETEHEPFKIKSLAPLHIKIAAVRRIIKEVRGIFYGDDNLLGIGPKLRDIITQETMTTALAKIGMVYTPEDKDTSREALGLRYINQVTFLKRRFLFDEEERNWYSPLSLNTIKEMFQWYRKCPEQDMIENLKAVCYSSLLELSQHEKETFDELSPEMLQAFKEELDFVPELTDQKYLRAEVRKLVPDYL